MTKLGDVIQRDTYASIPAAGVEGRLFYATDVGTLYRDSGAAWESYSAGLSSIEIIIDGGGAAITTGVKADVEVPFACEIVAAVLLADQAGDIVIDIWNDSYANFPPTDADSITAAAPPTLSAAAKSEDETLTAWTTALAKEDILRVNVDSVATIERVSLILRVART